MNENLKPFNELTEKEQRKIASMGGKASGEARRRRRDMKATAELLLSLPSNLKSKDGKGIKALGKQLGLNEEDIDNQMAVIISMFNVSMSGGKGAVGAATFLRDTVGDKPKEIMEVTNIDGTIAEVEKYLGDKECKKNKKDT